MQPLEQKIIKLLNQQRKRPLDRRSLAKQLNLRGQERKQLTRILNQLVQQQQLEERKGYYRVRQQQKPIEGTFSQTEHGYGFLRQDDPEQEDLFIPARHIGSAMDGDRVQVSCHFSIRQHKRYARVDQVIARAHSQILGHYQVRRDQAEVWPLKKSLGGAIRVKPVSTINNADVVSVEIDSYAEETRRARGHIVEHLGASEDPFVDIETIIRSHNLPHQFCPESLAEAEEKNQPISPAERENRKYLCDLPLVTIDGETARDFDDAVALIKEQDGRFRLWVCIADVAHYVEPQSATASLAASMNSSIKR